jgi:soluble lytic murein transglycosylase-like protein
MNFDQSIETTSVAGTRGEKLGSAQKAKLEKAVHEFESVFVGYLLKSMRNTVEKADNSTDGFGGDILESMFDVELARHISKNSKLGMADMLYRKLTGENPSREVAVRFEKESAAPAEVVSPAAQAVNKMQIALEPPKLEALTRTPDQPVAGKVEQPDRAQHRTVQKHEGRGNELGIGVGRNKSTTLDQRLKNLDSYVTEASEKFGVRDSLIKAVIATESAAKVTARSDKNAKGLMQLIDSTATEMGVKNVWDPRENILGGVKYLKKLLDQFDGDEKLAIASYNAGPGAVEKHGGVPPYKETKQYVQRVLSFVKLFQQQEDNDE